MKRERTVVEYYPAHTTSVYARAQHARLFMCVCVCVCERERERERVCVCVCINPIENTFYYTHTPRGCALIAVMVFRV
jgi:hypothetical protein